MKLWLKITLISVAVVVVLGIAAMLLIVRPSLKSFSVDVNNPAQFIQADFIDLSKIFSISKFRSGEGHDFSGNGETCRSMKHYFTPQFDANAGKSENGIPPKPNGIDDIDIFSPVDGTITQIATEHTPIGNQIYIVPDSHPEFTVRLFHVFPRAGLSAGTLGVGGTKVKAGEKVGVIGRYQGTDIAINVNGIGDKFVSYFQVMPDNIFAAYQARGLASRDDLIVTKEYRDAHPFQCGTGDQREMFIHPQGYDQKQDDVYLSGYVDGQAAYEKMMQEQAERGNGNQSGNNNQNETQQNYGNNVPQNGGDQGNGTYGNQGSQGTANY